MTIRFGDTEVIGHLNRILGWNGGNESLIGDCVRGEGMGGIGKSTDNFLGGVWLKRRAEKWISK